MAIRVKHAPSAEAIGESAYTIGRGEKRRWAVGVALRQQALNLQAAGMQLQAERSEEQLALRADELEFRKEQDLADRATAERRWQEEPSRQLQKGLQEQERLRKNITWQYNEGQKRELAHVITGIGWIRSEVAAGRWTAEQGEQAEQQLWQKYHSIIPLPVYDDTATPQERFDSGIVTHSSGRQYRQKADGSFEPMGLSVKDRGKIYTDILKAMFTTDPMTNEDTTNYDKVLQRYNEVITMFTKEDELATRLEEIQKRRAEEEQKGPSIEEQSEMRAKILALPETFEKKIKKGPLIGRKKVQKDEKRFTLWDEIYDEEAYNKALVASIKAHPDIPPKVIKAEFDKWWLANFEAEKGQRRQGFGDPREFEGFEGAITGKVKMKAPNGEIYEVDRSEVKEAKKHGWVMF